MCILYYIHVCIFCRYNFNAQCVFSLCVCMAYSFLYASTSNLTMMYVFVYMSSTCVCMDLFCRSDCRCMSSCVSLSFPLWLTLSFALSRLFLCSLLKVWLSFFLTLSRSLCLFLLLGTQCWREWRSLLQTHTLLCLCSVFFASRRSVMHTWTHVPTCTCTCTVVFATSSHARTNLDFPGKSSHALWVTCRVTYFQRVVSSTFCMQ